MDLGLQGKRAIVTGGYSQAALDDAVAAHFA